MALIRPFRGLRYTSQCGDLDQLVAPPYDVLSPAERDALAAQSECNIVHLTLPEQNADDRSKFVKYARSASRLEQMRQEGKLALEEKPAFYRYLQTFTIPGSTRVLERISLIATIKVEPYDKGIVLPHEQTFPKHKEDRLRILEATRSHLECIYGLFEDDDQSVFATIKNAPAERASDVTTDDGVRHIIDLITEPASCEQIQNALKDKKVWIADGHHRYETAVTFREGMGDKKHLIPEDFMMMALSSISDPGLVLLPTHRMVKSMPISREEFITRAKFAFEISTAPNDQLMTKIEAIQEDGFRAFGVAFPDGDGLILKTDMIGRVADLAPTEGSPRLSTLDVSILHNVIFAKILGLTGLDFFSYTRDPIEAVDSVKDGHDAAFLMNPPTVDDMRAIAAGGEKMPQKSTYYYPKMLSGLVLWSLNDWSPTAQDLAPASN